MSGLLRFARNDEGDFNRYPVSNVPHLLTFVLLGHKILSLPEELGQFRGVAQFGRALRSGRRSRRFKSSHSDSKYRQHLYTRGRKSFRSRV